MTNLEKVLDVFVKIKKLTVNAEKSGFRRKKVVSYGTIAYVGMELNQRRRKK